MSGPESPNPEELATQEKDISSNQAGDEIFDTLSSRKFSKLPDSKYKELSSGILSDFQKELEKTTDCVVLKYHRVRMQDNRMVKLLIEQRLREVLSKITHYRDLKLLREKFEHESLYKLIDEQIHRILLLEKDIGLLANHMDQANELSLKKVIIEPLFLALGINSVSLTELKNISTDKELQDLLFIKIKEKQTDEDIAQSIIKIVIPEFSSKKERHFKQGLESQKNIEKLKQKPQNIKKSTTKNPPNSGKRYSK